MKPKILIADSDRVLAEMYQLKLYDVGYDVDLSTGLDEAKELISKSIFSLLVVDMMENREGLYLISQAKKRNENIAVLVVSAVDSRDTIAEARKLGAQNYLIKSKIKPEDLVIEVNKILG